MLNKDNIIDPFGNSKIYNYDKICLDLGLKKIDNNILGKIKNTNRLLRRGIQFAHIGFDNFLENVKKKEVAVMTGIKPTYNFHLGSKMTVEEMIFFQKEFNAKVFYSIADLEGMIDNGLSLEKQKEIAIDNVADILAMGLDHKNAYIYRQSQEKNVMKMAYVFSRNITNNHLKNLYGERSVGLYFSAFTQCGDMLLPQLPEYGGAKNVIVPVGVDQAPHIFLSRDIVNKVKKYYDFLPVCGIFHKFFRSLNGESKMSKRDPMSMLSLNDSPEIVKKKIMKTLTGGQNTAEEQKKMGGDLEKSVVFELYKYHFVDDDDKIKEIGNDYKKGKILDGEMKKEIIEIIIKYLEEHQNKKKKFIDKAGEIISD